MPFVHFQLRRVQHNLSASVNKFHSHIANICSCAPAPTFKSSKMAIASTPRELSFSLKSFDYSKVPPEVWHSILHKIVDPPTFQNCSNVSSGWYEILETKRQTLLFPLVLPCISSYISTQDILNCRRVCKGWKNGVENYLPLNISWKNVDSCDFKINPEKQYWVSPLGNTFYTVSQITEFLSQMENCRENPFPTRTLLFYYLRPPEPSPNGAHLQVPSTSNLFSALRSLLRRFGDQIWTFVYITDHNNHPPLQAWMQLIFKFLPNIKKLRLEILARDPWGLQVFDEGWDWFKHLNPLPPHLISLHVSPFYSTRVTGSILEAVGSQLKYLGCDGSVVEEASYFGSHTLPMFIREMPALLELYLTRRDFNRGHSELKLLQRLENLHLPKLEKLSYLPDQNFTRESPLPFEYIFGLFNQFAPTLVELNLSSPLKRMRVNEAFLREDPEAMAMLGMPLPKLKTLGIRYTMVNHPLLEILLDKCVSLEKIRLQQFNIRYMDIRDQEFVIRPRVERKILKLNEMIDSTKLKFIELWARDPPICVSTWSRIC